MIENLKISISWTGNLAYTLEEIILLTGILGVHPKLAKEDNIEVEIYPYTDCVRIEVSSSAIRKLILIIYPANKIIYNEYIRSMGTVRGVGVEWVKSQTDHAGNNGFKRLAALAYRDDTGTTTDFCGYIVWGKFGYLLANDSVQQFENLMKKLNKTDRSIETLIATHDGLALWIKEGFSWDAEFNLAINSESRRILTAYIARKQTLS